jgi:hypothetical protein
MSWELDIGSWIFGQRDQGLWFGVQERLAQSPEGAVVSVQLPWSYPFHLVSNI